MFIEGKRFIGGVAEAPGARDVIEVTAACLARKEIKDYRLSQSQRVIGIPGAVRHTPVIAAGEDRPFRILGAKPGKPNIDLLFHIPSRERRAIWLYENFLADGMRAEQLRYLTDHSRGGLPDLPDLLDLIAALRLHGREQHRFSQLPDNFDLLEALSGGT